MNNIVENEQKERVIWVGHPSIIINLLKDILSVIVFFVIIFFNIPLYFLAIPVLFSLWNYILIITTKYQLTNERLKTSKGIINKKVDNLELYRVKDYRVEYPLHLRIFSLGNIILDTSDKSSPILILKAVANTEQLLNQIRKHVEERRTIKNIREVDVTETSM